MQQVIATDLQGFPHIFDLFKGFFDHGQSTLKAFEKLDSEFHLTYWLSEETLSFAK